MIVKNRLKYVTVALLFASASATAIAQAPAQPWQNRALSADERASLVVGQMTRAEKLQLVFGYFGTDFGANYKAPKEVRYGSAGYIAGIPRLGIPPQWQTDAGIGVATQGGAAQKRERTALPSGIATAATWNPAIGFAGGQMIGSEARSSGFNVMLAGGVNLLRDPRNGRNFEYGGEDPLLAGTMVGAQIAGIQSNNVISTIKHYAINDLETGRDYHDARINRAAARMSDLLAFQFGFERGNPGSVMCAYNRVNGDYACENQWLLTDILRREIGFQGYVMSDWGATHSTEKAALAGLDQTSGWPFDKQPFFREPLAAAIEAGRVPEARLTEMVTRILRPMFELGVVDNPVAEGPIDFAAHAAVTQKDAEESIVLLQNKGNILPLTSRAKRIVVIGGHADKGVLAGGGSSLTYPVGGNAVPGIAPTSWPGPVLYYPSSPLNEIKALAPGATVTFVDGTDPVAAAKAAAGADVALLFLTRWEGESFDVPMNLPDNQDALVDAVAGANRNTVAILETGGPVLMPWKDRVAGIVEAWYPGTSGGRAIANLLFGKVNPSGHLPVTFPASESQLPRPVRPGTGLANNAMFSVEYTEGAAVGYKWFDARGLKPLFPFGHGLSYTSFAMSALTAAPSADGGATVSFTVRNTGNRRGAEVAQVYVSPVNGGWEAPKRLATFGKVDLAPGQSQRLTLAVDPRLLATFDEASNSWKIGGGAYKLMLAKSAAEIGSTTTIQVPAKVLPGNWKPTQGGAAASEHVPERG
ncbi:MAG: beta-glucosidase family protein [Sphingomicrobium sp.]